ncbi:hypothetical protein BU23DRAFT_528555 [Bimuria novae-zelandiae CBS 107.79]|uniref:Rhodopsin domain-containing protein n=1 Tax=Bimuria novae-zelandiae CBS 107.79 TaxID=1447943 RepID=A0A6A5VMF4_9PLEO|nr:hypothetical protein BU23DRAFT_528555 [Bimuria novae-zelandiae CBS 107.79]
MIAFPAEVKEIVARHPGSKRDLGPFLDVVTWVFLVTSFLAVLTRLGTKRALRRRIDVDDYLVVGALMASVGSGVAVCFQTAAGLGRDIALLSETQIVAYQKAEYANKLLFIATLALAKLSIISLLTILTASNLHRKLGWVLGAFITVWGLVTEFVAAFQCGARSPWVFLSEDTQCLSMVCFWRSFGALNMITDLCLILFPVHVLFALQMSVSKKITIVGFFGTRSLDIIATAIQLAYTPAFDSPNPTRALWKWTMTAQVIECVTIFTSCVPYLRPLLESLPSGMYATDELRRRGTPSELGYSRNRSKTSSYKLSSTNSHTGHSPEKRHRSSQAESAIRRFLPMLSENTSHTNSASGLPGGPKRTDGNVDVEITAQGAGSESRWDVESTGSQAKIVKTTVVCAEWEDRRNDEQVSGSDEIGVARQNDFRVRI